MMMEMGMMMTKTPSSSMPPNGRILTLMVSEITRTVMMTGTAGPI